MTYPRFYASLFVAVFLMTGTRVSNAQTPIHPDVTIQALAALPGGVGNRAVRIVHDVHHGVLLILTNDGRIYAFHPENPSWGFDLWYTRQDHGVPYTGNQSSWGMDVAQDGTIYLLGNENVGEVQTRAVIRRGELSAGSRIWTTVATTEPYSLSRTWFDHRFSALTLSPDGSTVVVNSGSRTDHGEMYDGVREEGLTAAIFQIPADGEDLVLPNDREALSAQGFVFAEGTRNMYDLTFAPNGDLFGPDNSGDRDDPEELNWLREGKHYGFPWRMGTNDNPQQFPGYDPSEDPLVMLGRNTHNEADTGWYFSDDPTFPERPDVEFVDPIQNWGPDANLYRDEDTGIVHRASDHDEALRSFTGHRSPLGLVFDYDSTLADPFKGGAFLLSFNSDADDMLRRLGGHGEDMLFLNLFFEDGDYGMFVHRVAEGFNHPIDAEMIDNRIYVIEYGNPYAQNPGPMRLLAVTFPSDTHTEVELPDRVAVTTVTAYPNPFSSRANIDVSLSRDGPIRASLIDALGREVAVLADGFYPTGEFTLDLKGRGLPAGPYFVRVESDGGVHVIGIIRVRE